MKFLELDQILGLLNPDKNRIGQGKVRQATVWKNEIPDHIPIMLGKTRVITPGTKHDRKVKLAEHYLVGGVDVPEFDNFPHFNLKEQFYDPEKMLVEALWEIISWSKSGSDAQLSIRANHGVGIVSSIFGVEIEIVEDYMPWVRKHVSKEEILNFELEDIKEKGLIPHVIEFIEYFIEKLQGKALVYMPDTQGPFNIAHLVRGNAIFTDIYDDPAFVHHLMRLTTEAYIHVTKVLKEVISEPLNSGYHGSMYMEGGGVRLNEDTSILLSPDSFKEFCLPYLRDALKPFGGGWIHFCGDARHLLDLYLSLDEVKGINLGNPELYEPDEVMRRINERGKFLYGGWPIRKDKSVENYFRRILTPLAKRRTGLIFKPIGGIKWPETKLTLELWYKIEKEILVC